MKRVLVLLGVSLGAWLVACNDRPTGPTRTWTANLTGVVLDSAGNRIPSANVTMRGVLLSEGSGTLGRCSGSPLSPLSTQADLNGDYSIAVHGGRFRSTSASWSTRRCCRAACSFRGRLKSILCDSARPACSTCRCS